MKFGSYLLLAFVAFSTSAHSQKLGKYYYEYYAKPKDKDPLHNSAFERFVTDNFSYTILGAASPTTGIKVETEKPSITLRGSAYTKNKSLISTFDLTAGTNDNIGKIFSGETKGTYFKANLEFHFLYWNNTADYVSSKTGIIEVHRDMGKKKYSELLDEEYKSIMIKELLDPDFQPIATIKTLREATFTNMALMASRKHRLYPPNDPSKLPDEEAHVVKTGTLEEEKRFTRILTKLLVDMGATGSDKPIAPDTAWKPTDASLRCFISIWTTKDQKHDNVKIALVKTYQEALKKTETAIDSLFGSQIRSINHMWTTKSVRWATIGFNPGANNFVLYNPSDSSFTKNNKFLLGFKVALNWYWKYKRPHQFLYVNAGTSIREMTNVDEMTEYTYKKTTSIKVQHPETPSQVETITKEELSTGYEGKYRQEWGHEIFAEGYAHPWPISSIPGLYAKVQYLNGKQWINREKVTISAGLMWSVANKDKDKPNLLTIVPYAKWSNILPDYKEAEKLNRRPLHELFSVGVMLGIPINIGK